MSYPPGKSKTKIDDSPSKENVTTLSDQSFDKLTEIIENPPAPTQAMKDLMSKPRLASRGDSL
ncbi:hypothetical protein [Vibrio parahaemolyticus]|uniref:hypothetical protein n=1 Tax=Vibrio parahaemolyticus TaxID=670 RepID=UPI003D7CE69D